MQPCLYTSKVPFWGAMSIVKVVSAFRVGLADMMANSDSLDTSAEDE